MRLNPTYRVVKDHDYTLSEWDYHEWYMPWGVDPVFLDFLGRRNNGNTYAWLLVACNNSDCPAEAYVRSNAIIKLLPPVRERS